MPEKDKLETETLKGELLVKWLCPCGWHNTSVVDFGKELYRCEKCEKQYRVDSLPF
jgi:hypothetical protein